MADGEANPQGQQDTLHSGNVCGNKMKQLWSDATYYMNGFHLLILTFHSTSGITRDFPEATYIEK